MFDNKRMKNFDNARLIQPGNPILLNPWSRNVMMLALPNLDYQDICEMVWSKMFSPFLIGASGRQNKPAAIESVNRQVES